MDKGLKTSVSARMTAAEYLALVKRATRPKANKFRAIRVESEDGKFDSRGEFARFGALQWAEKIGDISNLKRQVRIPLMSNDQPVTATNANTGRSYRVAYVADFTYRDCVNAQDVIEDFKGVDTPTSRLKRAILAAMPEYRDTKILVTKAASTKRFPKKRK